MQVELDIRQSLVQTAEASDQNGHAMAMMATMLACMAVMTDAYAIPRRNLDVPILTMEDERGNMKMKLETDKAKRDAMIKEAFKLHAEDIGHLPLHQQALAWAYSNKVSLTQLPNNYMNFKWITLKAK